MRGNIPSQHQNPKSSSIKNTYSPAWISPKLTAMNILITGGTGFIGRALCKSLAGEGHSITVLTRDTTRARYRLGPQPSLVTDLAGLTATNQPEAVINLAGQNLGSGRWNSELKAQFITSRVGVTRHVVDYIARMERPPRVLVSGSAVGYYGARGDEEIDENEPPGDEFQSDLCRQWEEEAQRAEPFGVRVCRLRMGAVLGNGGGALSGLVPQFQWGLGGYAGNGRQWLPWIHQADLVDIYKLMLTDETLSGPFNATAPTQVANKEFAQALGSVLGRPAWLPAPGWVVQMAIGEMSRLYLTGQRVVPKRLLESGFHFQYPALPEALEAILCPDKPQN